MENNFERIALGIDNMAKALDLSESSVKKLIYRGELPAVKHGAKWLILIEDAKAYLARLPRQRKTRTKAEAVDAHLESAD